MLWAAQLYQLSNLVSKAEHTHTRPKTSWPFQAGGHRRRVCTETLLFSTKQDGVQSETKAPRSGRADAGSEPSLLIRAEPSRDQGFTPSVTSSSLRCSWLSSHMHNPKSFPHKNQNTAALSLVIIMIIIMIINNRGALHFTGISNLRMSHSLVL